MKTIKAACIQLSSSDQIDENLQKARSLILKAATAGAKLVALPEAFAFFGPEESKLKLAEDPGQGPVQDFLFRLSKELGIYLLGGSLFIRQRGKVYNRSCFYGPDGHCLKSYDKLHLFDVSLSQDPRDQYLESRSTVAGNEIALSRTTDFNLGLTICYDLRFPELYRNLSRLGAHILAVPSAFTARTGQKHWEILLRARAIENQCFVLAPNQVGKHVHGVRTYGHSMIVSPDGEIMARAGDTQPEIIMADLRAEVLNDLRTQIPCLRHRRFEEPQLRKV